MAFNNTNINTVISSSTNDIVGSIVDLGTNTPTVINIGTSTWMRSNTWAGASTLSTEVKAALKTNWTSDGAYQIGISSGTENVLNDAYPRCGFEIARIPASNISVIPVYTAQLSSYGIRAIVLSPSGTQLVNILDPGISYVTTTTGYTIVSNGSTFFCYYVSGTGTTLACKTSTDGITWTDQTVSGTPTLSTFQSLSGFWPTTVTDSTNGTLRGSTEITNGGIIGLFWCGARFVLINATTAGVYTTSTSTDGLTWSGDTTTTILGAATTIASSSINFYRNGNNCYLCIGASTNVTRKSIDGGVTWSNVTATTILNPTSAQYLVRNTTDPAKLIMLNTNTVSTAYYTSDSGGTWSANRALPTSTTQRKGTAYKGSVILVSTVSGIWRSADDGVTWTSLSTLPLGTLFSGGAVYADSNRFYLVSSTSSVNQVLTSSDGLTWTIRTTPVGFSNSAAGGLFEFSSNTVALFGTYQSDVLFTTDGGVTWTRARSGYSSNYGASGNLSYVKATPDGGSGGYACGMQSTGATATGYALNAGFSANSLSSGGSFYRVGINTIDPTRTNAVSYVKVV